MLPEAIPADFEHRRGHQTLVFQLTKPDEASRHNVWGTRAKDFLTSFQNASQWLILSKIGRSLIFASYAVVNLPGGKLSTKLKRPCKVRSGWPYLLCFVCQKWKEHVFLALALSSNLVPFALPSKTWLWKRWPQLCLSRHLLPGNTFLKRSERNLEHANDAPMILVQMAVYKIVTLYTL